MSKGKEVLNSVGEIIALSVYENLVSDLNLKFIPFLKVIGASSEEAASKYLEVKTFSDFSKFKDFLYSSFLLKFRSLDTPEMMDYFKSFSKKEGVDSLYFPRMDLSFIEYKNGVFRVNQAKAKEAGNNELTAEGIEKAKKILNSIKGKIGF